MLLVIVGVVVIGVMFVFGALLGVTVAQNHAGDRARRVERNRRLTDFRTQMMVTGAAITGEHGPFVTR